MATVDGPLDPILADTMPEPLDQQRLWWPCEGALAILGTTFGALGGHTQTAGRIQNINPPEASTIYTGDLLLGSFLESGHDHAMYLHQGSYVPHVLGYGSTYRHVQNKPVRIYAYN